VLKSVSNAKNATAEFKRQKYCIMIQVGVEPVNLNFKINSRSFKFHVTFLYLLKAYFLKKTGSSTLCLAKARILFNFNDFDDKQCEALLCFLCWCWKLETWKVGGGWYG
jgi:hypothetical protein